MVLAVALGIFASFLWGITNHIDKFMLVDLDKSTNNVNTLLVFSSLIAGLIISPVWLIVSKFSIGISISSLIFVLLAAIIYILATYFYYKALDKNDTSIVVMMFQMIPVFTFFLALFFFDEKLSTSQLIGSLIILLATIFISFDFENKNSKNKWNALMFMLISTLLYAVYFLLFDFAIRNSSYISCAFWYQVGFILIGIILMIKKKVRDSFLQAVKLNGKKYFGLNCINELINLVANLLVNYINLVIPLALANILTGFQGAFAFILGILGIKYLPKYFSENLNKKDIIQKTVCIFASIIGLFIMFV
ncbi:MAG: DMT family transporter [Firmicutes bacterium]|nr:DMT family transporter [Bacillota bacterium]